MTPIPELGKWEVEKSEDNFFAITSSNLGDGITHDITVVADYISRPHIAAIIVQVPAMVEFLKETKRLSIGFPRTPTEIIQILAEKAEAILKSFEGE